jgi:hypothetical protein
VVTLEARLRRELGVPAGAQVTITAGDRPGIAWEASWAPGGAAWSARTIHECNQAPRWRLVPDGEGGTSVGTADLDARPARRSRPPLVRVAAGQIWSARYEDGRTILVTEPDDNGRVRYQTLTLGTVRRSGKSWGRIQRQSLLSAYRLLPPDDPAYEAMRRDVAVRFPERWGVMVAHNPEQTEVITWFGDQEATAALARWLRSEAAWLAFRDWAFATEGAS